MRGEGVISAMKMRVYYDAKNKPVQDWSVILMNVEVDGMATPQLQGIPLGSLFGATGGTNNIYSAIFGKADMNCSTGHTRHPLYDVTGYFYFPMPFWKSAKITLEGTEFVDKSMHVCYEIIVKENNYNEKTTGYFHAVKNYYTGDVKLWRKVLQLKRSWGSFVGISVEIDKVRCFPNLYGVLGWAVYEADPLVFVDGRKTAVTIGTGLEDYFNVAHCWRNMNNMSYAFVGLFHSSPKYNDAYPVLTRHAYRLQVLDHIPFHDSFNFFMEGTSGKSFEFEQDMGYRAYMKLKTKMIATVSYTAFYYAKAESGLTKTDSIVLDDEKSRQHTTI